MPSQRQRKRGGAGAADYAISVYGNTDAQSAGSNGAIAVNMNPHVQMGGSRQPLTPLEYSGGSLVPLNPSQIGGKRRKRRGGNVLSDIAVPAALLYVNQIVGKGRHRNYSNTLRRTKRRKGPRRRKTFRRRR